MQYKKAVKRSASARHTLTYPIKYDTLEGGGATSAPRTRMEGDTMQRRKNAWDSRSMRREAGKARKVAPFWLVGIAAWAGVPLGSYLMLFHFGGTAFGAHELPWLVMYLLWLLFGGVIVAGQRLPKVLGLLLIAVAAVGGIFISLLAWGLSV